MKVTVEKEKDYYKDLKFPLLMQSKADGLVVLMTSERTGFSVSSTGKVILEND